MEREGRGKEGRKEEDGCMVRETRERKFMYKETCSCWSKRTLNQYIKNMVRRSVCGIPFLLDAFTYVIRPLSGLLHYCT